MGGGELALLVDLLVLDAALVVADVVDGAGEDVGVVGVADVLLGVVDGAV